MGSMTRDDAFGNAGADDMRRSKNGALIAARANGAIDVNFNVVNIVAAILGVFSAENETRPVFFSHLREGARPHHAAADLAPPPPFLDVARVAQ